MENCHALIVYSKLDDVWNQSDTTQCNKRSTFRQIQLELYWSVMVEFNVEETQLNLLLIKLELLRVAISLAAMQRRGVLSFTKLVKQCK